MATLPPPLGKEERKAVEKRIRMLPGLFRSCECYLQDYEAGAQNVIKLISVMNFTQEMIGEVRNDLIKTLRKRNLAR